MTRPAEQRVEDILAAIHRCRDYQPHLASSDGQIAAMAYDAILRNLAVIGEAVGALPESLTTTIVGIPWTSIAGLRNVVIHEYFRVRPDIIIDIVDNDLRRLETALRMS